MRAADRLLTLTADALTLLSVQAPHVATYYNNYLSWIDRCDDIMPQLSQSDFELLGSKWNNANNLMFLLRSFAGRIGCRMNLPWQIRSRFNYLYNTTPSVCYRNDIYHTSDFISWQRERLESNITELATRGSCEFLHMGQSEGLLPCLIGRALAAVCKGTLTCMEDYDSDSTAAFLLRTNIERLLPSNTRVTSFVEAQQRTHLYDCVIIESSFAPRDLEREVKFGLSRVKAGGALLIEGLYTLGGRMDNLLYRDNLHNPPRAIHTCLGNFKTSTIDDCMIVVRGYK